MAFSVIEWFVLVFAVLVLIKLILITFNPKGWFKFAKKIYGAPTVTFVVILILAAVLFYYLWLELGILMLMAGVVLGSLLTALTFMLWSKETMALATKIYKESVFKKGWFVILLWLVLMVWVLVELF